MKLGCVVMGVAVEIIVAILLYIAFGTVLVLPTRRQEEDEKWKRDEEKKEQQSGHALLFFHL